MATQPIVGMPGESMPPSRVNSLSSTARIGSHPIHPMLVPIPIVCFVGTLLTDLMYWATAKMQWADFSAWLVTVGVIVGWLAAILRASHKQICGVNLLAVAGYR